MVSNSFPTQHRRVVLAKRPPAEPVESDFRVETAPTPQPGAARCWCA